MAVNETIVTGRYFRRCTDVANKVWQRISFWHKASDCEFDDGQTAQAKVGAIKGITTSTSVTETGYAADMTTVKNLQTQINELNSNLGNKPVLLWTNEENSKGSISTVSNKTIELTDVDKYNAFIIEAQRSTAKNEIVGRALLFKTDRSTTPFFWIGGVTGDNDPTIRKIYVTDTGIYFQNPTPSGAGASLVPKRIYGINIELN